MTAPQACVIYNDFVFPPYSNYEVTESYRMDAAEMTVIETQFLVRVKTILAADTPVGLTPPIDYDARETGFACGTVVRDARQRLSKVGKTLVFQHDGFSASTVTINGPSGGDLVRDVNGGPKPRVLIWRPIGNTNAVEIEWECETCIPVCDGVVTPRFTGVKAFNYAIAYDIDPAGFTTRRITGYIEIAMTRKSGAEPTNREIPDTVDAYRDKVKFEKPNNFTREISWNVSTDKRRADFTIVDRESRSSNPFPPGVISINARHRVAWNRRDRARIPSTISATIELSPLEPRIKSWLIFRSIVDSRIAAATAAEKETFIETLDMEEELFDNKFSFQLSYYTLSQLGIPDILGATGLFQPLEWDDWQDWHNSTKVLMPFQGLTWPLAEGETGPAQLADRGLANLKHDPTDDRIIDLCDNGNATDQSSSSRAVYNTPTAISPYCNAKPPAGKSWLYFDARFIYEESSRSSASVTLGPSDIQDELFDPEEPTSNLTPSTVEDIERFIENYAGEMTLIWQGSAERVGWPIKKPGKMQIGEVELTPVGKRRFIHKRIGTFFCQPVYAAVWSIPYKLIVRPGKMDGEEAIPDGVDDPEPPPEEPEP